MKINDTVIEAGRKNLLNIALSVIQIITGVSAALFVKILADSKAGEPFIPPQGEIWAGPPADSSAEFILVILGLLITICGYLQIRRRVNYAALQVISGLIIVITFTVLVIRAATLGYYEQSHLYYYVYLLVIPGFAAALLGIVQLLRAILLKYRKRDTICNKGEKTS